MTTTFDRLFIEPRRSDEPAARPARSRETETAQSPSLVLLVLLASAGIVVYALFLLNPANRGDWLPYVMVIAAETVLVVHALLAMWTVLASGYDPRGFSFHHAQDRLYGLEEILQLHTESSPQDWTMSLDGRTVTAALAMHGHHETWVLDDGRSDEVAALAAELGARYVRRLSSNGAKAGNLNHALSIASGDLFVVLDADFVPLPTFLHETVPFFAKDDVAFVQTPQTY